MFAFLLTGVAFGLSAGFAPGPLMAFVISQTLRYGSREGLKASFAPLVTDLPIILASVYLMHRLAQYQAVLGGISCLGGVFALYLAWECFWARAVNVKAVQSKPQSLAKATVLNALSPHPYLFWLLVGAPQVTAACGQTRLGAIGFIAGFYACLIGAKLTVAIVVGRTRHWLTGRPYRYLMLALSAILVIAAALLIHDGLRLLNVLPAQ